MNGNRNPNPEPQDAPGALARRATRGFKAAIAGVVAASGVSVAATISDGSTAHAIALAPVDTLSDNPADGYTLREAINDANGLGGVDTITFDAGVTGTLALGAQLSILDGVRIIGPGSDLLTLDGGNASRIVQSQAPGTHLTLEGMTLANGNTAGPGGALIFHDGESLTLDDVVVRDSQSPEGGGISISAMNGKLSLTDVEVTGNTATASVGGGLLADGVNDDVSLERVTISGNTASFDDGGGGGIVGVAGDVTASDLTVSGNTAAQNFGGFRLQTTGSAALNDIAIVDNTATAADIGGLILLAADEITVDGMTVTGNSAPGGIGGGARLDSDFSSVTVTDATVTGNDAAGHAAITVVSSGQVSLSDSTIADNIASASVGGPIVMAGKAQIERVSVIDNEGPNAGGMVLSTTSDIIISHSTVALNSTTGTGGGLTIETTNDDVFVRNSTISGNTANDGAAFAILNTSLYIDHSTVVDNTTAGAEGVAFGVGVSSIEYDHSIVAGNAGSAYNDVSSVFAGADHSLVEDPAGVLFALGTNVTGVDPQLGPLADNGGPTTTHLPAADSSAIDAGDPGLAAPLTDQRGGNRFIGIVDIGSVERAPEDTPPAPPAPPAEPPVPVEPSAPEPAADEPAADAGTIWIPVEPARLLDTRPGSATVDGQHAGIGLRPGDSTLTVEVAGRAGVPLDAVGVIVNLTAVQPVDDGFATAHACLAQRPDTASLNYSGGTNLGNEIILELDDDGQACLYNETASHLTLDVVGYVPAGSPYTALQPARYADTRAAGTTFDGLAAAGGKLGGGDTLAIPVAGRGGVPGDADAVVVYVAAVQPDATGFVTAHGCDEDLPNASALNHVAGVNRGNEIIVQPDADGDICLFAESSVHLTADVVGFIPSGTDYAPLAAGSRLLDTRATGSTVDGLAQAGGMRAAGSVIEVPIAGRVGIANDAATAVFNLTAVGASDVGYATAFDCDGEPPLASNLNYVAGVNGGNEIIAGLSDTGSICIFVESDTHLTIDVAGATSPA